MSVSLRSLISSHIFSMTWMHLLSLKEALDCYIEHRREVVVRRTRHLLEKAEDRAETLEALLLSLGRLDDFIEMKSTDVQTLL